MKKFAALTLSIFLSGGTAFADTPKDADARPAAASKPGNAAKAAKAKAKGAEAAEARFAAELEELRQTLQSQQEQLQSLKEELAKRDRQIDEAREAAAAANGRAVEASSKAVEAANTTAEVKSAASSLNTTVSALRTNNDALATTVARSQADAKKAEETGPASIRYKGISITPGGFFEGASVFRSRAVGGDINTPFTGIPYPGNSLAKVSENNFTGRHSRISSLFETKIGAAKATGYYEADFLGAGTTSNNRQSNSYVFRQRQIWGQVALDSGWSFTGGQMWSLAAETRKGIQNRQETPPLTIDPQYNVGFTWARQYGFRVVKDFGGKFAVAVSIEGPQTTLGGRGFSTFTAANGTVSQNFFVNIPGAGGGLFNAFDGTGYTPNKAPDIIVKAAADPGYGHYEVFGIISTFRNRIYPCSVVTPTPNGTTVIVNGPALTCGAGATTPSAAGSFNDTRTGGGLGASLRVPLFKKKLDFAAKAVGGDGIGRYGSAQLADATARPDGTLALIRTAHGMGGLEFHPNAKLDVFAYYGAEYAWRAAYVGYQTVTAATAAGVTTYTSSNTRIGGYGSPFANNNFCSTENPPSGSFTPSTGGTCAGDIRLIQEGTMGFWHKFYSGPKGGLRWGIQYSYFTKSGWSGNNNVPTAFGVSPKAVDNMVWTSFRYYIP